MGVKTTYNSDGIMCAYFTGPWKIDMLDEFQGVEKVIVGWFIDKYAYVRGNSLTLSRNSRMIMSYGFPIGYSTFDYKKKIPVKILYHYLPEYDLSISNVTTKHIRKVISVYNENSFFRALVDGKKPRFEFRKEIPEFKPIYLGGKGYGRK